MININTTTSSRNTFKTHKQAESSLAYAQLTQLMAHTGDCDVDWSDTKQMKYTIIRLSGIIIKDTARDSYEKLTFKTATIRDEFLEKHIELIKTYYEI